jgi:hypothetical protein
MTRDNSNALSCRRGRRRGMPNAEGEMAGDSFDFVPSSCLIVLPKSFCHASSSPFQSIENLVWQNNWGRTMKKVVLVWTCE